MQIIILNGPPSSGKDSLADHLVSVFRNCHHKKYAASLKAMVQRAYGVPPTHTCLLEENKDTPHPEFQGLSPRQAYINFAELYLKPTHGQRFLGQLLVKDIYEYFSLSKAELLKSNNCIVISDGGFLEELLPLVQEFKPENIFYVHIFRQGKDWSKDSRNYVSRKDLDKLGVELEILHNSASLKDFLFKGERTLYPFIRGDRPYVNSL